MINFCEGVRLSTIDEIKPPKMREWRNDFSIWKWCRQFDLITEAHHSAWLESLKQRDDVRMYSIISPLNQPIGVCGLTSINHVNRNAEFSLYVAPNEQGHGYAKAALKTLIHHGFSNLGLNSIWGETYDGNHAAKIFESIGFIKEGTRRSFYFRSGKFIDCHLYSILQSEWPHKEQVA